jgi:SAM-dependent methyltransferase
VLLTNGNAAETDELRGEFDFIAAAKAIESDTGFTGGPAHLFEKVGRDSFDTAVALGLRPRHKFLDFGAGTLRLGYWFVRYLNSGKYYAIEPMEARMEAGKKHLLGPDILRDKAPHFYVSNACDMTTFGVRFNFVIARSVLTHTKPGMLRKMLEEFSKCAKPNAVMLASYWALDGEKACTLDGHIGDQLPPDDFGFVGVIKFSPGYLKAAADQYGLIAEDFGISPPLNQQIWVTFRPKPRGWRRIVEWISNWATAFSNPAT